MYFTNLKNVVAQILLINIYFNIKNWLLIFKVKIMFKKLFLFILLLTQNIFSWAMSTSGYSYRRSGSLLDIVNSAGINLIKLSLRDSEYCQEISVESVSILKRVVERRDSAILKLLLEVYKEKFDDLEFLKVINSALDEKNNTALHYTASFNDVESTKILLSFGASALEPNIYGQTPYDYACNNKDYDEISELLRLLSIG